MNRLEIWLEKEAMGWQAVRLTLSFFLFAVVYSLSLVFLFDYLGWMPDRFSNLDKSSIIPLGNLIMFLVVITPIMEELIFRFIPLYIILYPVKKDFGGVMIVALVVSVFFGYLHGGIAHIFIQGVVGFGFCLLFLKCGGYHRRYFKGYCCSVSVHALLNLTVLFAAFLSGAKF